jgi:hypothetical protein
LSSAARRDVTAEKPMASRPGLPAAGPATFQSRAAQAGRCGFEKRICDQFGLIVPVSRVWCIAILLIWTGEIKAAGLLG